MKPKNKRYKLVKVFDDTGFVGFLHKDLGEFWVCYNPWSKIRYDEYLADDCRIEKEWVEMKPKTDREPQPQKA